MVNNPRGKSLNQSDRSSYFTPKSAAAPKPAPYKFSLLENGNGRNDFRQDTVTFFGMA